MEIACLPFFFPHFFGNLICFSSLQHFCMPKFAAPELGFERWSVIVIGVFAWILSSVIFQKNFVYHVCESFLLQISQLWCFPSCKVVLFLRGFLFCVDPGNNLPFSCKWDEWRFYFGCFFFFFFQIGEYDGCHRLYNGVVLALTELFVVSLPSGVVKKFWVFIPDWFCWFITCLFFFVWLPIVVICGNPLHLLICFHLYWSSVLFLQSGNSSPYIDCDSICRGWGNWLRWRRPWQSSVIYCAWFTEIWCSRRDRDMDLMAIRCLQCLADQDQPGSVLPKKIKKKC